MSKGAELGVLLDAADKVHHDMNMIFIGKGLSTPDLSTVTNSEREEWYRLKGISDSLAEEMGRELNI